MLSLTRLSLLCVAAATTLCLASTSLAHLVEIKGQSKGFHIQAGQRNRQSFASSEHLDDPLAEVLPLFGHSPARHSFTMPQDEEPAPAGSTPAFSQGRLGPALEPHYEVNRPTRVLPERDLLTSCTVTVATKSFSNSYGQPVITTYSPDMLQAPCNDPSKWVFIELTLSGNVSGRQFDRLGSVQLDGVEVLRTDNPEPTRAGVKWTFAKEMNKYYDLWKSKRTVVFDFPNIVNDVYTGALNTTLSFTAYVCSSDSQTIAPLSTGYPLVLALSKQNVSSNSFFSLGDNGEDDGVTLVKMPPNARAALVELYASGTSQDEFWYTNVPDELYEPISSSASQLGLFPRGPLREIQVLIDDRLAGVAQPFPVVFTGGISPFLWRPQVAFGAYDQPTYYVDVSPFLGSLCDDAEHKFQLRVVSAEKNQTVLSWFVSGNVQVQLDSTSKRTTGSITTYEAPLAGQFTTTGEVDGDFEKNAKLHFSVSGQRRISIQASLQLGSSAKPYPVSWEQELQYSNTNNLNGSSSTVVQTASGQSTSIHDGLSFFSSHFSYPFTTTSEGSLYTLDHGYDQTLRFGQPDVFKEPSSQSIRMNQDGKATMVFNDQGQLISGNGTTTADYSYEDSNQYSFTRSNTASNGTVTHDDVGGTLGGKAADVYP